MNEERTELQDPRKGAMPERMALTVKEAAELLGIGRNLMYTIINRADFPSFVVGSRRLIPTDGLREWVRKQAEGASA